MKMIRIAMPLIAAAMMTAPMVAQSQSSQPQMGTQNQVSSQAQVDWMTPPAGTEQAQAYKDGIEAAKLDTATNRPVVAEKSHLYVKPPVKNDAEKAKYRASFTAGYTAAVQHGANKPAGM